LDGLSKIIFVEKLKKASVNSFFMGFLYKRPLHCAFNDNFKCKPRFHFSGPVENAPPPPFHTQGCALCRSEVVVALFIP
jgi:hypothetical protein